VSRVRDEILPEPADVVATGTLRHLWSPWRIEYIKGPHDDAGCIFCEKPAGGDDAANLVLARRDGAFALLNAYPYNPGHIMVAPRRHTGDFESLQPAELADVDALIQESLRVLREAEAPHGFNIGMNLSRSAGAGIPDHLHWHIVPRWTGDTNFISIVGETRVLPELLAETYAALRPGFDAGQAASSDA
jgi:ATP adenylyltransferase